MRYAALRVVSGLFFALTGTGLGGGSSSSPAPKSVSWYLAHQEERTKTVVWCQDDATRWGRPNCLNAAAADQQAMFAKQKTVADDLQLY
jgi:hypothetical protein